MDTDEQLGTEEQWKVFVTKITSCFIVLTVLTFIVLSAYILGLENDKQLGKSLM